MYTRTMKIQVNNGQSVGTSSFPYTQAVQTNYSRYIKTNLGNLLIVTAKASYILLQSNGQTTTDSGQEIQKSTVM